MPIRSPILIAASVMGEVSEFITHIDDAHRSNIGKRDSLTGYIANEPVRVIITGIGVANTVQALTAAIEQSRPSMLIQVGCAGAFRESGLNIGDIGIAGEEIDVHLGIEPDKDSSPPAELPFPILSLPDLSIKNRYPLSPELTTIAHEHLSFEFRQTDVKILQGPFITVATLTATDRRARDLYAWYQPCMENMEGTAAAHVSLFYELPFLEIRTASNRVGKRNRADWNLPLAFERSSQALTALIYRFSKEMPTTRK